MTGLLKSGASMAKSGMRLGLEHQVWIVASTEDSKPSWQAAMKLRRQVTDIRPKRMGENTARRVCGEEGRMGKESAGVGKEVKGGR